MVEDNKSSSKRTEVTLIRAGSGVVFLLALALLASCRGNVRNEGLPKLDYAPKTASQADSTSNDPGSGSHISYEVNIQKEQAVADGCLKAWRKAVRDKDEEGAMEMLDELDKKYSGISSVQFMMGQVKDHFGKHEEAVEHFRRAHSVNEFSSMQTYKLAESMRKAGDARGSIVYYQKLIGNLEAATGKYGMGGNMKQLLHSVRLGLARSYVACKQKDDALSEVNKVLKDDPANANAKALLDEIEKN